ncbi:MAG TPA: hypothetical protein VNF00_00370 [Candidatus Acidoferrales bacterium]|nr:hypothetical protein [Candidatus Acidoferrales bacterium]
MSNGLFLQSYPAVGVQIVPATYYAGKFGYFLMAALPAVVIILLAGPANVEKSRWLLPGLAIYLLGVAFLAISLPSLKLDIRTDGISYTNLFRKEEFLAFTEISTAVLFTNQWCGNRERRMSFTMPGKMVITPKPDAGKAALKIPLYLFPDAAQVQLTHLLRPEEWDTDS